MPFLKLKSLLIYLCFISCVCPLGVAGFTLQRCPQCQRLHPGVWHLLCGELWICQNDQTADSGAQVRSTTHSQMPRHVANKQLVNPHWSFLMTSSLRHPSTNRMQYQSPATKALKLHIGDSVTVIDSLLMGISFNSEHSLLHTDSLTVTFDSGIAAWEQPEMSPMIYRLFL